MALNVVLYEDGGWQRFLPLVYLRTVYQLVCGCDNLMSKTLRLLQNEDEGRFRDSGPDLWCRAGLAEIIREQYPRKVNAPLDGPTLLLNGRGLWHSLPECDAEEGAWVGVMGGDDEVACIFADAELAAELTADVMLDEARVRSALAGLPRRDIRVCLTLFDWPWQVVLANKQTLANDWANHLVRSAGIHGQVDQGSYLLNRSAIHVGAGSRIKPCVVIDAEDGPVWIGDNVTIQPHCTVIGPAYIGDGSLLQPGAVVHKGTTIGNVSKIGGEIEESIVHGYSNKQHDGFLGHSYIGSWVNIAADCINSDLKNTYGTIRVPINGHEVETGEMFVGMIFGDYSKSGINVSFPTGSVIGFCSSVFAPRCPKFVASFSWIDGDDLQRLDEQRGLIVARKVMARRKRTMSRAQEAAFLAVRGQALAIEHAPQRMLENPLNLV